MLKPKENSLPMIPKNLTRIPENIMSNKELIEEALDFGCRKAKVISTSAISLARWVKLQCQFGCSNHAKLFTCPPYTPESDEMAEILEEYDQALLIHANGGTNVQEIVLHLETSFKKKDIKRLSLWVPNHVLYAILAPSIPFASTQRKLGPLCRPVVLMLKPR